MQIPTFEDFAVPDSLKLAAFITIDGLAVCYFENRLSESSRWEVVFLRRNDHDLKLKIGKLYGKPEEISLGDFDEILISTRSGSPYGAFPKGCFVDGKEPFDRLHGDHSPFDYRWVFNLNNPHDFPDGVVTAKSQPGPAAVAYIHNTVFYTQSLTPQDLYRVEFCQNPNKPPRPVTLLGRSNEEIGGLLFGEDKIEIQLVKGSSSRVIEMQVSDGPYWIQLMNMRPHEHHEDNVSKKEWVPGDFGFYYDAVECPKRWQLWGEGIAARGDRIDCDSIGISDVAGLAHFIRRR